MLSISGQSADEVWRKAFTDLREEKNSHVQPGRGGNTRELLHVGISIDDPRQRWVVSRRPPINPAFAIAETLWILAGRNDAAFLTFWNSQLHHYVGDGPTYHGAYGFRLRRQFGFDQLQRSYLALKHNPTSRQVVLQIWDAQEDLPDESGSPADADIPCNILAMLKVRNGALEWMQVMRSNDIYLGLPYNVIQFSTLQEVLAGWLDLQLGSYTHVADSLHAYCHNMDSANIDDLTVMPNTDSLSLPKEESDLVLSKLAECIERLAHPALTERELERLLTNESFPQAFRNLLLVTAAESARRRRWGTLEADVAQQITNPVLVQAWSRWASRVGRVA